MKSGEPKEIGYHVMVIKFSKAERILRKSYITLKPEILGRFSSHRQTFIFVSESIEELLNDSKLLPLSFQTCYNLDSLA